MVILLRIPILINILIRNVTMMMNCFCEMIDQRKAFTPYLELEPLSEILTIANL